MWLKYDSYFDAFTTKKYAVYGKYMNKYKDIVCSTQWRSKK